MADVYSTSKLDTSESAGDSTADCHGEPFKKFLCWLLEEKEPEDMKAYPNLNTVPLFVFVSKKGYWIYRLMTECLYRESLLPWRERLQARSIEVKSDRYFTKMVELDEFPPILCHRRIYVVDDFLIKGQNIGRFCRLIRDKAKGSQIFPVVFAKWEEFHPENDIPEFENLCSYCQFDSLTEIGRLSTWETQWFHRAGIPYVIDLPFLTLTDAASRRTDSFFSGKLSKQQFQHLCGVQNSLWSCIDNSYTIADYKANSVFFHFQRDLFQNKFRYLIQNLVVKCQYDVHTEDETVSVTFTPFAMLRSVRQDELIRCFRAVYRGTAYGRLLEDYLSSGFVKSADKNLNTALYRSVVFFLSRYISINFKNYLKRSLDVDLDLWMEELKPHWPDEFIDSLPDLFEGQFRERLSSLYDLNDITPYVPPLRSRRYRQSINMYFDIFTYFAVHKKMAVQEKQFCSIEELEDEMAFYKKCSPDSDDFKTEFTSALLQLLNQGVISNQIRYDEDTGVVCRGFRSGENGTLLLPFNQKAIFSAIYKYYSLMGCNRKEAIQTAYDRYFRNYSKFKFNLLEFIKQSELDSYFNLREAEDTLSYFGMLSETALKHQVENKTYIIEDLQHSESADGKVARLLAHHIEQVNFE